jgi:POT family proton-dependent oligopeptide transporter
MATATTKGPELFGYPTGLFNLFFAEMWERFSYYGMRALLVLYMMKGFLRLDDGEAYKVYGAYTALVYMTPFFGGLIADRLLGARRAVVFGGLLMAAGHLLMTIESEAPFFGALALLIVGNGFFKPNISTMVGGLYEDGDPRRDGGFTLFYIGINLGAAMAPLVCGLVGETYGWHYGFGLATVGMLIGLAVFVVPNRVSQVLILGGAITTAIAMVVLPEGTLLLAVSAFVALALLASGIAAFVALGRGGLSDDAGQPKDPAKLKERVAGIPLEYAVYLGTLVTVPVLAGLVWSSRSINFAKMLIAEETLKAWEDSESAVVELGVFMLNEISTPPGLLLTVVGGIATVYLLIEAFRSVKVERERLFAVLIMMIFSMLFWAFFEQAGSSVTNFTDRNIDRVFEERVITEADVGQTLEIEVTQEQLGYANTAPGFKDDIEKALGAVLETQLEYADEAGKAEARAELKETVAAMRAEPALTMTGLDALTQLDQLLRKEDAHIDEMIDRPNMPVDPLVQEWVVTKDHVGMGVNGSTVPASTFQSANAIFIMIFGLIFSTMWTVLARRGLEPNTPVKFSLGLLQLGLGFAAMWYGVTIADDRGMTGMTWVLLGYLLHTTGELCLSPVGLSMVTRLSPKRLVSTLMGAWFLATAFSNYLAAIIAALTNVGHGSDGGKLIPVPAETIDVYGGVFGQIAITACVSALVMLVISPLLKKWMHEDQLGADASASGH